MSKGKHSDGKINKKKVTITIIIILVIIGGIVWGINSNNKKEEVSNANTNSKNEKIEEVNETKKENITNTNSNENTSTNKNETTTNKVENKEENKISEAEKVETQEYTEEEEKALTIAKKEWGNSAENVYFTIDNKEGNEYTITVRSKDTTNAVLIFIINIETGEVTEK